MSPTIRHKYKYFHSTVQRAKDRRQKFHFCRLPFDVRPRNVKLNLSITASSAPGHKHLREQVLVVQFLFEASDLATEVTPKASSTCENEAEGVQRRPSTKRALSSDQYSELEDEITSSISRSDTENLRRTSFRLTSRLSRHNFCSLFLV